MHKFPVKYITHYMSKTRVFLFSKVGTKWVGYRAGQICTQKALDWSSSTLKRKHFSLNRDNDILLDPYEGCCLGTPFSSWEELHKSPRNAGLWDVNKEAQVIIITFFFFRIQNKKYKEFPNVMDVLKQWKILSNNLFSFF